VAAALMAAGGTLPTFKPGKMRLERGGDRLLDGKELAQAVAQGRTLDDLNVQDGDQLVVRRGGAGMGDNLRFVWVVVSITGGIVGLTKVLGHKKGRWGGLGRLGGVGGGCPADVTPSPTSPVPPNLPPFSQQTHTTRNEM